MSDPNTSAPHGGACIRKDCQPMNTPSIHQVPLSANRSPEPPEHLPRLSRNSWDRPDLARLMDTENAYAPYITPRRQSQQ